MIGRRLMDLDNGDWSAFVAKAGAVARLYWATTAQDRPWLGCTATWLGCRVMGSGRWDRKLVVAIRSSFGVDLFLNFLYCWSLYVFFLIKVLLCANAYYLPPKSPILCVASTILDHDIDSKMFQSQRRTRFQRSWEGKYK